MNSSLKRLMAACIVAICLVSIYSNSMAGNYTWTGSTSSAWNTATNWSPSGVPGTNDTVTIGSGSDTILLADNITINRLIMSGRVINVGGKQLTIAQRASLNGGKIYNGKLLLNGTYAFFQGANIGCNIVCIVNQIKLSGGTFDGVCSFEHNGSANGWGEGGCVFNDSVKIKSSGTSYLRLGQSSGDTFNGPVEFISTGTYPMQVAFHDSTIFKKPVRINSTSGGISFCSDTTGQAAVFQEEAYLLAGSTGITGGTITLKNFHQETTNTISITAGGTALITVVGSTFNGKVTISSPGILSKSSTYNDSTTFTRTANNTTAYQFDGGNIFNGVFTLTSTNTSSGVVRMANKTGDKYNADAYFNTTSTAGMEIAYSDTSEFKGNIFINHSKVVFNKSKGVVRFAGSNNQTLSGNATFLIGKLKLNKDGGLVTLNRAMTIDSLITFTNGIISTDSVITLKASTTCSGASNQSFVDGPVKKIGNTAFVFPVGDEGRLESIEISAPTNNTESFTARYIARPAIEISGSIDSTLSIVSGCNYWSLIRNSGSTNVKVRLYWDTIGCALFDTASIRIAEYSGNSWKSLGKTNLIGNSDIGNCQNADNVTSYSYFTFGIIVTTVDVTLDITNSPSRTIQQDFFGFNGANTIERNTSGTANQTWADIYSDTFAGQGGAARRTLAFSPVGVIRYPAGTLANYFDWRAGWYIREKHLPYNWLYDKPKYRIDPDYGGNELADFAQNLNLMAARPILVWNIMTSKLPFEIASTYRLGEVNLPLNYIELGNEFYLNDDQYKQAFPSVLDYLNRSKQWIQDYRNINIPQSLGVKFAVVGSDYGDDVPGRRKMWLQSLLANITATDKIAAVTVHDYIGTGLTTDQSTGCTTFGPNELKQYLNKAFKDGETLRTNTFADIQAANQGHLASDPLQIWLTEFNNLDDENSYIGTWPHGLFNAAMALQYLETPEVAKVITHTMISDGVFGNIFESNQGFENISCHGAVPTNYATRKGEFTALGNALNQIALALKNATNAKKMVFTPTAGGSIPNIISSSNYPVLYGWYFENSSGEQQMIILNLDFNPNHSYNLSIPSGIFTGPIQYDQLTSVEFQNAILGTAISTGTPYELQLVTNSVTGNTISLSAGTITRIYQQVQPLQLKLTDSEICQGSSTSLVISGGNGSITVTTTSGLTATPLPLGNSITSDHYWEVTGNSSGTNPETITVSDGTNSASINLMVHEDLTDLEVTVNGSPVSTYSFCPTGSDITLSATFNPGSVGSSSNSNANDFHFLWAPDTGIVSNNCAGPGNLLPFCNKIIVHPQRTTNYTVYVTNDHCWKSASVLVTVPISSVSLGPDINACAGSGNPIVLEPKIEFEPGTTINYNWSGGATTAQITINSILAGPNVYIVTVSDPLGCTVQETVQINGTSCCSGILNSITVPPANYYNPASDLNEYFISEVQLNNAIMTACPSCVTFTGTVNNKKLLTVDMSSSSPNLSIVLNQSFVIRDNIYDDAGVLSLDGFDIAIKNANILFGPEANIIVRQGRILTFENCTLNVCGNEMWKGIEVEPIAADGEPHLIMKNCVIMNAERSVLLGKNAQFEIENCTFTDNYIDLAFEKYSKKNLDQKIDAVNDPNGMSTQNYIRSNTFTSSGGTLLSPYNTMHKFAAIVLDDVERVVIGDSSEDASVDYNYFSSSNFGIKSNKSNFEVYHSDFDGILDLDPQISRLTGTAIYAQSAYDNNDRKIIIGNKNYAVGSNSHQNHFVNLNNGIVASGEMNVSVFNNAFGNGVPDNRIKKYGIWINGTWEKSVYITRENVFHDYYTGIRANMIHPQAVFHIGNNTFNNAYVSNWNAINSFEGTAIYLANYFGMPVNLPFRVDPQVVIFENTIGEYGADIQPRIGIFASQIFEPVIQNNEINYYRNSPVTRPHSYGIWTQNCNSPFIASNTIRESQRTYQGYGANLIGIRSDRNLNPCIGNMNTIESLGYALYFSDNNGIASISTNIFDRCDNGVYLDSAEIGQQGTPVRTDDNEWYDLSSSNNRVNGLTMNNIPVRWYWNSSNSAFAPIPSGIVFDFPSNNPSLAPVTCPTINNIIQRNNSLGGVVTDTVRYNENYAESFNYTGKQQAFKVLRKDTNLLNLDDPSDTAFISFYDEMQTGNLNTFDNISSLICEKKNDFAMELLEAIEDTNMIETLLLSTFEVLITLPTFDSEFSSQDSTTMLDIAYTNPLLNGDAVYSAGNMMFYEMLDDTLGSNSRMLKSSGTIQLTHQLEIYPNPTSDFVIVSVNHLPYVGRFELLNSVGQIIKSGEMAGKIDTQKLSSGLYQIRVSYDQEVLIGKIAVIK